MTQEQIINNNKLIADFMGWENNLMVLEEGQYQTPHIIMKWIESPFPSSNSVDGTGLEAVKEHTPEEMLFHKSWDWLMPVVKKCHAIDPHNIRKEIGHRNMYGANINIVYEGVVEFIKFYNSSTTK